MKKFFLLVLGIFAILNSCTKSVLTDYEAQKKELIEAVTHVADMKLDSKVIYDYSLTNCNNPNDIAGILTSNVTFKVLVDIRDSKSESDSIISKFMNLLSKTMPETYLYTDTSDYTALEYLIKDLLIDIYSDQGFNVFILKSKEIEDIICESSYFNEIQKKRILIFSSVIRQNVGQIKSFISENKSQIKPDWEECFISKLRELQDCGNCFLEKIYCAFSWPTCLGIKALDCLISTLT